MKKTRAGKAGYKFGESVVEMIHLMYQNKTAYNFLCGLKEAIDKEWSRRNTSNVESIRKNLLFIEKLHASPVLEPPDSLCVD